MLVLCSNTVSNGFVRGAVVGVVVLRHEPDDADADAADVDPREAPERLLVVTEPRLP